MLNRVLTRVRFSPWISLPTVKTVLTLAICNLVILSLFFSIVDNLYFYLPSAIESVVWKNKEQMYMFTSFLN